MNLQKHDHWGLLGKGFLWLLSLIVAAAVGAAINYYFTERSNQNAVVQQQNYSKVELFERTGNELDAKFSSFADAVVDKQNLKPIVQELRVSIAQHSSTVTGLNGFIGAENSSAYLQQLSALRQLVDQSTSPQTTVNAARLHTKLIEIRWKLAELAKGKIYGTK